jgi:hypothetical protein
MKYESIWDDSEGTLGGGKSNMPRMLAAIRAASLRDRNWQNGWIFTYLSCLAVEEWKHKLVRESLEEGQ